MTEFHKNRITGIGCSELGVIFGRSSFMTPFELWEIKTGLKDASLRPSSIAARHGTFTEDFIAKEYMKVSGKIAFPHSPMLVHPDYPLIGHVDRLIVPGDSAIRSLLPGVNVLEIKTVNEHRFNVKSGWGEPGSSTIPYNYYLQVSGYMSLVNCEYADVAVLVGGQHLHMYRLERNRVSEKSMLQYVEWWWNKFVVPKVAPDILDYGIPSVGALPVEISKEVFDKLIKLEWMKTDINSLIAKGEALAKEIDEASGGADELAYNGAVVGVITRMKTKTKIEMVSV
jgi:putative phage-type endonuclease